MSEVLINIEAEQAILGSLLLNNSVVEALGHLKAEHFHEPAHGRIFSAILECVDAGGMASPVTMKTHLIDDPGLPDLGGVAYLARLAGSVISIKSVPDYCTLIIELCARRELVAGLDEASGQIRAMENMDRAAERVDEALMASRLQTQERPSTIPFKTALARAGDHINQAFHRGTGIDIPTGINELDEKLGGLSNDEMVIIGGRPSMGKSALAIEIMRRQAELGLWCIYWSSEMSEESVALRMLSTQGHPNGPNYHNAGRGRISEDEFRSLLVTAQGMEQLPIRIIDSGIRTLPRILREVRRNVRRIKDNGGKIGSVIIDYMQQITPVSKGGRFDGVTEISMAIKALQMELRVPFIALSQLSRKVEERENKRPMLSDLRESGQIEQDGNKILFVYRDEYYLERMLPGLKSDGIAKVSEALEKARGVMDVIIAKQRTGPICSVPIGYDAPHNRIYKLEYDFGQDELTQDEESF